MPRVKVSITDVYNAKDHAMGFDSPRLVEAAEKAIAWLVQQTGADDGEPYKATFTPKTNGRTIQMTDRGLSEALEEQAAVEASDFGKALDKEKEALLAEAKKAAAVERMAKARAARAAKRNVTAA